MPSDSFLVSATSGFAFDATVHVIFEAVRKVRIARTLALTHFLLLRSMLEACYVSDVYSFCNVTRKPCVPSVIMC